MTAQDFALEGRAPAPFHPHGISLAAGRLYVINHFDSDHHAIETFRVDGLRLVAEGSPPTSGLLVSPKVVAADVKRATVGV